MLLHIIARGKIGRSPEAELVDRYAKRIAWPMRLTELPERGGTIPAPVTPCRTVALDERGRQLPSSEFAAILSRWRDDGVREVRFVIGAADGHGSAARDEADLLLAFGAAIGIGGAITGSDDAQYFGILGIVLVLLVGAVAMIPVREKGHSFD